jgi:hypothetical protein
MICYFCVVSVILNAIEILKPWLLAKYYLHSFLVGILGFRSFLVGVLGFEEI